jgi:hypothetical protein
METYSFLNTIRLEGSEPSEASVSHSREQLSGSALLLPFTTSLLFESWERVGGNRGNPLVGLLYQLRANAQRRKVGARVDKIVNLREGHLGESIQTVARDVRAWRLRSWRRSDRRASRRQIRSLGGANLYDCSFLLRSDRNRCRCRNRLFFSPLQGRSWRQRSWPSTPRC